MVDLIKTSHRNDRDLDQSPKSLFLFLDLLRDRRDL